MRSTSDGSLEAATEASPHPAGVVPSEMGYGSAPPQADEGANTDPRAGQPATDTPSATSPPAVEAASHSRRKWLLWAGAVAGLVVGGYLLAPAVERALYTVSTDDAYVNGDVTLVAPRVPGQVARVLVHDNYRVKKGDLLVQLDREPYQVQVDIKKAAVVNAEADLKAAEAQVRAILGQARSLRWKLQTAIEKVDDQVALLAARVAALRSKEASLDRAGRLRAGRRPPRPPRGLPGGVRSAPRGTADGRGRD